MIKDNITLGEMKVYCSEMVGRYGDQCCKHCEFAELGCCDAPDQWQLEETGKCSAAQPDWEELYNKAEEAGRRLYMKCEDAEARARVAELENLKLRTIVATVETMLGRKFDV